METEAVEWIGGDGSRRLVDGRGNMMGWVR
jgi:hypothetical protein